MPGRPQSDACLDELPFFVPITMGCGCHIEFHSVHPPLHDLAVLTEAKCPWCKSLDPEVPDSIRELVATQDHLHVMYRRGDAAFRRGSLSPDEWEALSELEKEMGDVDEV